MDQLEDKRRVIVDKRITKAIDILPKALRFLGNINVFQKHYLSTTMNALPILPLQQVQIKGMKSVPQNIINGGKLLGLVYKKTAETVNVPKNEIQIDTVEQPLPSRMLKPQGIAESTIGNQAVDINHLTDQVMELFEQRLKTEQERRGIFI